MFRRGFTLVELLVTISIVSFLAVLTFFGISSFNNSQPLNNASYEVLSTLRSVQNKALNGAGGMSFQTINLSSITLPPGITITNSPTTVCFANPNLVSYAADQCGTCTSGTFFACVGGTKIGTSLTITLKNSRNETKSVIVDGVGILVNRIYAQ